MSDFTSTISDEGFHESVLESPILVMVYFWAGWADECRYMTPTVNSVAKEKSPSLKVVLVNVDESPATAMRQGIALVPTIIFYASGKELQRIEGVTNHLHLSRTSEMHLSAINAAPNNESDSVN